MPWFLLLGFGIGVGVLGGMLGIGGGVVLVPGLILLFGFTQQEAQGTSLAVMIPPIGLFAAMVYYQHGFIRLPVVGLIALGFMIGAFLGAKLVPHIPLAMLRIVFGILLLYIGFAFILSPRGSVGQSALPAGIAAVVSGIIAFVLRRPRPPRTPLARPDEDLDYHI